MQPNNPYEQPAQEQPGQNPPYPPTTSSVAPNQSQMPQQPQPQSQFPQQAPPQAASDYEFIVHPDERPRPKPFENTKLPVKIAVIGGGVIVLLIIFNILRGVIAGPSVGEKFLSIAQDQQQIITIVTEASKQQGLSTVNANSAITTQLGLGTDQTLTLEYMAKNGKKTKGKDLSILLDGKLIEQLEASAAAGTYNETYKTVMAQQLEAYLNNMSQLYKQIDGQKGKALLDSNYKSAKLLLQQLQAT